MAGLEEPRHREMSLLLAPQGVSQRRLPLPPGSTARIHLSAGVPLLLLDHLPGLTTALVSLLDYVARYTL